jgi:hypothetical protein
MVLIILAVVLGVKPAASGSLVGDWRPWTINAGSILVVPPELQPGKLTFRKDGSYVWLVDYRHANEGGVGRYHMKGATITLSDERLFRGPKFKPATDVTPAGWLVPTLYFHYGQLWDESYVVSVGSCIYVREGAKPKMPKHWPRD